MCDGMDFPAPSICIHLSVCHITDIISINDDNPVQESQDYQTEFKKLNFLAYVADYIHIPLIINVIALNIFLQFPCFTRLLSRFHQLLVNNFLIVYQVIFR